MIVRNIVLCTMAGILLMSFSTVPVVAQDGGYRVFRPDGPGPHPAVVFLSHCGGLTASFAPKGYEQYAGRLRDNGFVVVWADYIGRRHLENCVLVSQKQAAQDAVEAALWLRSQPDVDARRITVMGWSYGGGAVLTALANYNVEDLIFTRAITYYPYLNSFDMKPWSHRLPLLVLLGDADDIAPPKMTRSLLEKNAEKGDTKVVIYPGAQHCFDFSELPPGGMIMSGLGTLSYNPGAAAAAWEEVQRFLGPAK